MFNQDSNNGAFTYKISADGTKILAVSTGTNSNWYYSFWNGTTYTNWSVVPNNLAILTGSTGRASIDNTKLIVWSYTNLQFYYALYTGITYTNWVQIPDTIGIVFTDIDGFSGNDDNTKVFSIDTMNNNCYSLYSNGQYSPWVAVPNPNNITFINETTVKCCNDGSKIYKQDTNNNYYYSVYNVTTYTIWTLIPNTTGLVLLDSILTYYYIFNRYFLFFFLFF